MSAAVVSLYHDEKYEKIFYYLYTQFLNENSTFIFRCFLKLTVVSVVFGFYINFDLGSNISLEFIYPDCDISWLISILPG